MEPMSQEEVRGLVRGSRLAILSLARGDHAYAFPLFYGYSDGVFYFHAHPGEKDGYIRATEEACLTIVSAVTEDDWASVMAFGHVQEAHMADEVKHAMDALIAIPPPPELGQSEHGEPRRSMEDVHYWLMRPTRVTGRKSVRPPFEGPV